jgi:hypothetical protein
MGEPLLAACHFLNVANWEGLLDKYLLGTNLGSEWVNLCRRFKVLDGVLVGRMCKKAAIVLELCCERCC